MEAINIAIMAIWLMALTASHIGYILRLNRWREEWRMEQLAIQQEFSEIGKLIEERYPSNVTADLKALKAEWQSHADMHAAGRLPRMPNLPEFSLCTRCGKEHDPRFVMCQEVTS